MKEGKGTIRPHAVGDRSGLTAESSVRGKLRRGVGVTNRLDTTAAEICEDDDSR
jgi:hypothetical protein